MKDPDGHHIGWRREKIYNPLTDTRNCRRSPHRPSYACFWKSGIHRLTSSRVGAGEWVRKQSYRFAGRPRLCRARHHRCDSSAREQTRYWHGHSGSATTKQRSPCVYPPMPLERGTCPFLVGSNGRRKSSGGSIEGHSFLRSAITVCSSLPAGCSEMRPWALNVLIWRGPGLFALFGFFALCSRSLSRHDGFGSFLAFKRHSYQHTWRDKHMELSTHESLFRRRGTPMLLLWICARRCLRGRLNTSATTAPGVGAC